MHSVLEAVCLGLKPGQARPDLTLVFSVQTDTTTRQAATETARCLGLQVLLFTLHPTAGTNSGFGPADQADQKDPQATRGLLD